MVIDDALRLPLLTIEWIFVVISLELGIIFLLKFFRQEKQLRTSQEFGYAVLFFGLCLTWFFLIIGDYYMSEILISPFYIWGQGSVRDLFINFSYLSLTIGTLAFSFSMEKHRVYLFKRYVFTFSFLLLLITFLIAFFISLEIIKVLSFIIWPLFILFLTIYLVDFYKSDVKEKSTIFEMVKFLPPFILVALGFFLSHPYIFQTLPLGFRLGSSLIQLSSLGLIFYFSIRLPPFAEFDWKEKIVEILVMTRSGVCIFHQSFTDKTSHLNEVLMSGALISVNILLEELTSAKLAGSSIVKKKGRSINLFSTKYLTGVLISKEELSFINYNLKQFVQKVETIYKNVLIESWTGDISIFAPVQAIVNEFFM